jgi:hypothetical protein
MASFSSYSLADAISEGVKKTMKLNAERDIKKYIKEAKKAERYIMKEQTIEIVNKQRYSVVVPRGVKSGHNFAVIVNGQRTSVRCPENVTAGQRIDIVVVPRGVQPSHNFSARCPENVAASGAKTLKERLSELQDLYNDGLLEESEYKEKKKEILK